MLPNLKRLDGVPRSLENNILLDKPNLELDKDDKQNFDLKVDKRAWYTETFPKVKKEAIDFNLNGIKTTVDEC